MSMIKDKIDTFKRLKADLERIQRELDPIKSDLEMAALNAGGTLIVDGSIIKLVEASRESVSLKDAKIALGNALDPFLKTSFYTILKVN